MAASRRTTPSPDVMASAQYVFRGTVTAAGGSNLDGVAPQSGLAVVRLDQIVLAPPEVGLESGQEVTVALSEGRPVRNGERLIFYATSWHYGTTVGVQEIGRQAITSAPRAAAAVLGDP